MLSYFLQTCHPSRPCHGRHSQTYFQGYFCLNHVMVNNTNGYEIFETPKKCTNREITFGAFCFWMLTTFPMLYVIEDMDHGRPWVIGCVGIYDLTIGHKLWLSLAIFRPADRRQGYGKQAVSLLPVCPARQRVVSNVYAAVLRTNTPSLRFFVRLGFAPDRQGPDYIRLVKHLGQPQGNDRRQITVWPQREPPADLAGHRGLTA
jgi:RimJ/RimL family protein N-acetyltransferase